MKKSKKVKVTVNGPIFDTEEFWFVMNGIKAVA